MRASGRETLPERATGIGESRWAPVATLAAFMAANLAVRIWLPHDAALHTPWLTLALEAVLLPTLVLADPTSPSERRRLRRLAVALVALLVAAALWATTLLVSDLIRGVGVSRDAGRLLATGAVVWLGNNLAFALAAP